MVKIPADTVIYDVWIWTQGVGLCKLFPQIKDMNFRQLIDVADRRLPFFWDIQNSLLRTQRLLKKA